MRHLKRVVPCVAALAGICMAAGPAQAALPEFNPAGPIPFSSTSGKTTLETVSKVKLTCKADTNKGEIVTPSSVTIIITFTGCESKGIPCNSAKGAAGEITTALLIGKLGYIVNPEIKEVGLDLSSPTGAPIAEFLCGAAVRGFVQGSVIGQITPVNKPIAPPGKFMLRFRQKKGKQAITHLFAEPIDVPLVSFGGPLEEAGLNSSDKVAFPAAEEVKA